MPELFIRGPYSGSRDVGWSQLNPMVDFGQGKADFDGSDFERVVRVLEFIQFPPPGLILEKRFDMTRILIHQDIIAQ